MNKFLRDPVEILIPRCSSLPIRYYLIRFASVIQVGVIYALAHHKTKKGYCNTVCTNQLTTHFSFFISTVHSGQ